MIRCLSCRAETSNGLALCELCQRGVSQSLTFLPLSVRNLSRWRPGRTSPRQVPGSRVLYEGTTHNPDRSGDRISDALDEAFTALTTRARSLVNDRPHLVRPLTLEDAVLADDLDQDYADAMSRAEAVAHLCSAFDRYLTSIATTDWCGEFVREIQRHDHRLRALTETYVPGWYAGRCRHCQTPTYVVPGLTWLTCSGCGATTFARDHIDIILVEARDWVAPARRIAEALVALVDTEQSVTRLHDRIRQWDQRGKVSAVRRIERAYAVDELGNIVVVDQETGTPRYRLGDVFDTLTTEGATRTMPSARAVSC